jgi:hypothetical protein
MMRHSFLILCVLIPLKGSGQDTLARVAREETTVYAQEASAQRRVVLLKAFMSYADSLSEKEGLGLRRFARLGTAYEDLDTIVSVSGNAWPESTSISFAVQLSPQGRIIAVTETPMSFSGDWYNFYTTYFDSTGKTVAFLRSSAFYNGCNIETLDTSIGRPAREVSEYYYNFDNTLLEKTYHFAGLDGSPIEPSECGFNYRHEYLIYVDWIAFAKANGLPQVP